MTLVKVFSRHIGHLRRGREIDDRLSAFGNYKNLAIAADSPLHADQKLPLAGSGESRFVLFISFGSIRMGPAIPFPGGWCHILKNFRYDAWS